MHNLTGHVGMIVVSVALLCCVETRAGTQDAVELLCSPANQTVIVGDEFEIGLIARSVPGWDIPIAGLDVILNWDASRLELLGTNNNGPYDWMGAGFPNDIPIPFGGINDGVKVPPLGVPFNDGDAWYRAQAQMMGDPAMATQGGLLVTSFMFRALEPTGLTQLSIPLTADPYYETVVISGTYAGLDILVGPPEGARVEILPESFAIPAASEWGLMVVTLLLLTAGTVVLGRRRRAVPA